VTSTSVGNTVGAPRAAGMPDHSRFPELDGVRALAVTFVIATHAAFWTGRYVKGNATSLLAHLDVGVSIFFVLSGFLLSREWLIAAAGRERAIRVPAYLWRRALRILPMYWITVAIAMTTLSRNRRSGTAADWLHNGLLIQIYGTSWARDGLTQTWSLCTEAAFYLLLPFLGVGAVAWCRRFGWRPSALLAGCAALVVANVAWLVASYHASWAVLRGYWLPSTISWFAAGVALAIAHTHLQRLDQPPPRWEWVVGLGRSPGVCWTVSACLFLLAITPLTGTYTFGRATAGQEVTRNLLYLGVAVTLVWPCIFGRGALARAIFGNRVMRWIGEISYSMFLLHLAILYGVMDILGYRLFTGSAVTAFTATMGLTILASALAYRLVERPAMRLRRLVPATAPPRSAAQVAAAEAPS
jgi:peptidoglycan/LPS O-acetylase OafA/YrhL